MSDEINTRGESQPSEEDEYDENSVISLTDDEGRSSEYEILDAIETQEGKFVALMPLASINDETAVRRPSLACSYGSRCSRLNG